MQILMAALAAATLAGVASKPQNLLPGGDLLLVQDSVGTTTGGALGIDRRKWVVYAVDERGRYGFAYGAPNLDRARSDAVAGCSASGCHVVMQAQARCQAFAESRQSGYAYGVAYGPNLASVRANAVGFCASDGAAGCQVVHSACAD